MAMTRMQLRHAAAITRYQDEKHKPPTRAQARAWLDPIRRAFNELKSGEIDAVRGYAITRIHWADEDYARVDWCINGFTAMLDRLMPEFDTEPMKKVSRKLSAGVPLTVAEIDASFAVLNACESLMITFKRSDWMDVALTEQLNIELERLGFKEAA